MYHSPANFSGWFRLNGQSRKTFNTIVSTKFFFLFRFGGGEPQTGTPLPLGAPLPTVLESWNETTLITVLSNCLEKCTSFCHYTRLFCFSVYEKYSALTNVVFCYHVPDDGSSHDMVNGCRLCIDKAAALWHTIKGTQALRDLSSTLVQESLQFFM